MKNHKIKTDWLSGKYQSHNNLTKRKVLALILCLVCTFAYGNGLAEGRLETQLAVEEAFTIEQKQKLNNWTLIMQDELTERLDKKLQIEMVEIFLLSNAKQTMLIEATKSNSVSFRE